jgi:hypothetical protein
MSDPWFSIWTLAVELELCEADLLTQQQGISRKTILNLPPLLFVKQSSDRLFLSFRIMTVNLWVVSPDTRSERRIDPHITVENLRVRILLLLLVQRLSN